MTPYFICYAILVIALAAGLLFDKLRLAALAAFIPMFILIVSRGLVGTDSTVYVQQFDVIHYQGLLASGFEPGFSLIVLTLTELFPDPFDVLILLGGLSAILMISAGLLLERSPLFFLTIVLPYFMLDMTMNGLRYGMAFSVVALGAAALLRDRPKAFIACSVIAASIQVSAVALALILWVLIEVRIRTIVGILVGVVAAVILFGDYLREKLLENSDLYGLGGASGIAPLIATIVIAAAIMRRNRSISESSFPILLIVSMQFIAFGISRYYYAGLRIQSLIFFLMYLFLTIGTKKTDPMIGKNSLVKWSLVIALLVSSASRLKNFNDDVSGPSPFNPYYFSSEVRG